MIGQLSRWEMLQKICTVLDEYYGLPLISFGITEGTGNTNITPAAFTGYASKYLTEISVLRPDTKEDETPELTAVKDNRYCYIPDTDKLPDGIWKNVSDKYGFKSVLVIPITAKNRVKGTLALYASSAEYFFEEEIAFLVQTGRDIGSAVFVNRSVPKNQFIQKELLNWTYLQQKNSIIASQREKELILSNFSKGIVQSLSVEQVVDFAVDSIIQAVSPDLIMIFLENNGELILHRKATPSSILNADQKHPLKVGECLCGRAAQTMKPVFSSRIESDRRCTLNSCRLEGVRSFAAIPIVVRNRNIGVLGIASASAKDFSAHKTFLETLGGQFAVGLENALLFAQLSEKAELLEKEVTTKTILLKEIHHRVKNNLNIIASLLSLQLGEVEKGKDAKDAFIESRGRIYAMAQVHEKLYETENFSEIEMSSYIENVTNELIATYNIGKSISLETDIESIRLDINQAVPFGLILNEIISNSLKYAFPGNKKGVINISLKREDGSIVFTVRDNGVGIPETINPESSDSLGLTLIHLLTDQIDGTLNISRTGGTEFVIRFPFSEAVT